MTRSSRSAAGTPSNAVICAALLCCLGPTACRESEEPPESKPNARLQPKTIDIDTLRAMPYVEGTPADEKEPEGVIFHDSERACRGFRLYCVEPLSRADLIDESGIIITSWSHSPSRSWANCELLPNGDLLVVGADPGLTPDGRPTKTISDQARYILRFDWDGRLLWKRKLLSHHDIEATPDGKLLLLTFRRRFARKIHATIPVRDDLLALLRPNGTVIELRSMLQAVERSSSIFPLEPVQPSSLFGPTWVDLFHANSIEWMRYPHLVGKHPVYDLNNILVCFRHQNRIAVFNWRRNVFVWAWGQDELRGPHDAQVLENGHILVFDNGLGREYSRAIELDPTSGDIVWQYEADPPTRLYTESKGSVQRLPNGNTLLAESDKGYAFEITPDGDVVWEFLNPYRTDRGDRAALARIKWFSPTFIASISDRP